MRNIGRFVKNTICTVTAAAGMLALSGCTNYSKMMNEQPQEYISMASENTAKAMVKSTFAEEYSILESALKEGSFEIGFKADDTKFNGEFYINEKDVKTSQLYTFENDGGKAEIYAAVEKDGMKIGTVGESGTHVYSIDFDTLAEDFAASIFAPDSGSSYAMDQDEYDTFAEAIGQFNSALKGENDSDVYDECEKLMEDFLDENKPEVAEKSDAEINGEAVKSNVITYTFDKDDIVKLTENYFDIVLDGMDEDVSEYYTNEELKEEVMSLFDELDSLDMEIVYYINNKTHVLMQGELNVKAVSGEETVEIGLSMVYGADPAAAKEQTFEASAKVGEDKYSLIVTAENEDNSTTFNFDIAGVSGGMNFTTNFMTIECERTDMNYTIKISIPMATVEGEINGTVKTDSKSFELTVDNIAFTSEGSEVSYAPEGRFSADKGGKYLNFDAEKNLFKLTEEEMDSFVEAIDADFSPVLGETEVGETMNDYVDNSRQSAANANAKMAFTALSAHLTQMSIQGETFSGYIAENNGGTTFVIDGIEQDLYDYLGSEFTGYCYAEIDSETYSVNFALWSEEPIPDEYKYQLSEYLMEYAASEGNIIGCYPASY